MGMAASQARLLTITAEMHNIEYQAQRIQAEKIALATQEDQVYQKYCDALDATKVTVAYKNSDGSKVYVDANYATVCGFNPDRIRQYGLVNNRTGKAIVSEDVKQTYEEFGNDKYSFAWAMLGFDQNFNWTEVYNDTSASGYEVGIGTSQEGYIEEADGTYSKYMTEVEEMVFQDHRTDSSLKPLYEALVTSESDGTSKEDRVELLDKFRTELYRKYGNEIFDMMNINKQEEYNPNSISLDFPNLTWGDVQQEFNYYVQMWNLIHNAGGCEVMDPEYESGDNGTEWFNNMVKSGLVSIHMFDDTKSKGWTETSVATSIGNNYLQEEQDEKNLKKAEAEYEHEMNIINKKDTHYDTELKKLETRENALKQQIDQIKNVIKENTQRTFNIFGS